MTLGDALMTAIENLATHKLRSVLTMLGMIFGVGAVIAMLSIGEGAEREAMEMIERLGVRNILVRDVDMRDDELSEVRETSPGVSPRDAAAIADAIPEVELTCRRVEVEPFSVLSEGRTVDATAHGVDASFADLTNLRVSTGSFFDDLDVADHAQVCVIGEGVRRELFGYEEGVGQVLKVNQLRLEIVGVIEDSAGASTVQGVSVGSTNLEIYLPVTTAIRKLDLPLLEAPLDEIIVRLAGVVVGVVISKVVAVSAGWSTVVTLWSVVLAFGVSMAVGIGSGLYPAQRAAKLNPTDALRWE